MALPFKPSTGGGGAAIGSVVTGLTAGSVPYGGAGGVLAQDTANFFYDGTGHTLTLGAAGQALANYGGALYLQGTSGPTMELLGAIPRLVFTSAGASDPSSPQAAVGGNTLAHLFVDGFDGHFYEDAVAIVMAADGDAIDNTAVPGRLSVKTSDSSGALLERLRLTSQGTTALAAPQSGTSAAFVGPVEIQGTSERWVGSTSGVLTHAWPATITSHTLTWPAANAPGALCNDGAGALSWASPITVSNVTSTRALNTTYANAYSNKAVMVFATVKCTTALLGGSATATPSVSTSATPTVSAGGTIGIGSGIANESNQFQICFVVPAGSNMNYRLDTASANGSASLNAWFECTF